MVSVKLRQKPISGNRKALYLDFYPAIVDPETGKATRREFLRLYVLNNPKNPIDKQHNKETLTLGEAVRSKRQLEIQNEAYEFNPGKRRNKCFVEFFEQLANKRKASNADNWISALHYLKDFTSGSLPLANLNEAFCNDFKEYLLTVRSRKSEAKTLATNSAVSYFNKLKAALKQAFKDGLLKTDLNGRIEPIKPEDTYRNYLTSEELQLLINTDCAVPVLKQAAIFSALTGLRFGDVKKLTWRELHYSKAEGHYIRFIQEKTDNAQILPIPEEAINIISKRGKPTDNVFPGLEYSDCASHLQQWVSDAGIDKKITFHCFRHTNATLLLSLGADLYTVSKMLGHRNIKTTQIYAKIIDKTKREAADKMKFVIKPFDI